MQALLDAIDAVGDLAEVMQPRALVGRVEGRMVCSDDRQDAARQTGLDLALVLLVPDWRAHHVLCSHLCVTLDYTLSPSTQSGSSQRYHTLKS